MFVDPEEAQVRVPMIIRVDQNDVWFLGHSGEYDATYRSKKSHFKFHKFIDCLNFPILEDKASNARWNVLNSWQLIKRFRKADPLHRQIFQHDNPDRSAC